MSSFCLAVISFRLTMSVLNQNVITLLPRKSGSDQIVSVFPISMSGFNLIVIVLKSSFNQTVITLTLLHYCLRNFGKHTKLWRTKGEVTFHCGMNYSIIEVIERDGRWSNGHLAIYVVMFDRLSTKWLCNINR